MVIRGRRQALVLAGFGLLGAGIGALLILDSMGAFRGPSLNAEQLFDRMRERWARVESYDAEIAAGDTQSGPTNSRQWWARGKYLIVTGSDSFGFRHTERWTGDEWDYYQPGAWLNVTVKVRGASRVALPRWQAGDFAPLDELMWVLTRARNPRLVAVTRPAEGTLYELSCTVDCPETVLRPDLRRILGANPWQVWLSDKTGLPVHVQAPGVGEFPPVRIGIRSLQLGSSKMPADWRSLGGTSTHVRSRMSLSCDLSSPQSLRATRLAIRKRVDVWRSTRYQRYER